MAKEKEQQVSEEEVIEQPQESTEEVVEEPKWKSLGFETEDALYERVSKLDEERKRVNDEKSELGRLKKEIAEMKAAIPKPEDDDDLFTQLDPKTAEQFRKAIQKEAKALIETQFGPQAEVAAEVFNETAESRLTKYAESSGLDKDELLTFMSENNLLPAQPSIRAFESGLKLAVDAFKGRNVQAEVDKRVAAELAKLKAEGAEIKDVEQKGKKAPDEEEKDPTMGTFASMLKAVASGKL